MRVVKVPLRTMSSIHYRRKPMTTSGTAGYGLGNLFSRLGRFIVPLAKSAVRAARPAAKRTLKQLGRQGLQAAAAAASDVITDGMPVKKAIKKNIQQVGPEMRKTALKGVKRAVRQVRQKKSIKRGGGKSFRSKPSKLRRRRTSKKKNKRKKKGIQKKRLPYKGIFSS